MKCWKNTSTADKEKAGPQPFEAKLDLANDAQRMMEKVEDVQIIDSLVVDKDDFLSAYILSEESGTLDYARHAAFSLVSANGS